MTLEFWTALLSIVVIDLTLAGDNALVIAMAVRSLPRERQFVARLLGTGAAVALRLALITVATYLLELPFLQAVGGLLLVWIAVKLVRQDDERTHTMKSAPATSMWQATWIILVADAVMSLDNVLAVAGAAGGELVLVVFGIGLSIPLVVWGSGLLARLMDRFMWIIWLGGGILGYVAVRMFLRDAALVHWLGEPVSLGLERAMAVALGALIVAVAWWSSRARVAARQT